MISHSSDKTFVAVHLLMLIFDTACCTQLVHLLALVSSKACLACFCPGGPWKLLVYRSRAAGTAMFL